MALFTQADRDAIKAAMVRIATDGIASVTLAGQTTTVKSLDELRRLLEIVQSDIAAETGGGGMRVKQLVPGGTG